ncbi:MAG: CoA transferase [Candidatus Eremiobacteraeota bacterium]|nr:CoA transferase [Candidatus Eremiobacteraeota bacterium]
MSESQTLRGIRVVTLAPNLPGPVAAARLRDLGAEVHKVEPPAGDFLEMGAPAWYADLHRGMTIEKIDLKLPEGRATLDERLAAADVFLTSSRPSALERLGLGWERVHERFPQLVMVAIVGEYPPHAERAGHDLTYVAEFGLIVPPAMPRTLVADLAGAERAVSATLALLFARTRGEGGSHAFVSLREAAETFGLPLAHGLTAPGGRLSGAFPGYRSYATRDGWIAIAALEPHFWARMQHLLGTSDAAEFEAAFAERDSAYWTLWAAEHDMPLLAFGDVAVGAPERS